MIYLLRHGEDDENYVGGWSDVQLTNKGIEQVEEVSKFIKNLQISKVISSDIMRAKETAFIVSKHLKMPVQFKPFLRELDKGLVTGMKVSEAKSKYPSAFKLGVAERYPNGESMIEFYKRVKESMVYLENDNLYVTHRGYINMLYFILSDRMPDLDKKQFGVEHASLHELDIQKKLIRRIK